LSIVGEASTAIASYIIGLPIFRSLTSLPLPVPRSSIRFASVGSKAIVSFTKNAEIIPKPITNTRSIEFRSLPALDNIFTATNLRTPDLVKSRNYAEHSKKKYNHIKIDCFKAYDLKPDHKGCSN
jgi:hypothetical protein